jgi:hypothetical protein
MITKFTVTLDGQTFSTAQIRNISLTLKERELFILTIDTEKNGTFCYEALMSEKEKLNTLLSLKNDLISTLKMIVENNLSVE